MRHHVNPVKMVEGTCRAKKDEACPFYRGENESNHFATKEEAAEAAQKMLQKKHGLFHQGKTAFIKKRDIVEQNLKKYGVLNVKNLPKVSTQKEMIDEWFNGDVTKLNKFNEVVKSEEFSEDTKRSILKMVMAKGIQLNSIKDIDSLSEVSDTGLSAVTIIEEDADNVSIEDIRNKKFSIFG